MLMRYAVNLAGGHGIVWNVGGHPIDGATDLGYMAVLAGVVKAGIGVERAARVLNLVALLSSVVLCYLFARRFHHAGALVSGLTAAFLALGPAKAYISAGFGAPFFGFFIALVCVATEFVRRHPSRLRYAVALGAATVVAGLVRPEGFLIGACCFAGLLVAPGRASRRAVAAALAVALAGGAVFVMWRWSYFGYPLPNPYYKKGGERLHFSAFLHGARSIGAMTWPLLAVAVAGVVVPSSRRRAASVLVTLGLFSLLWLLISDEMNYRGRFQYPALVILAFATPGIATDMWSAVRDRGAKRVSDRGLACAYCVALASGLMLLASSPAYQDLAVQPQLAMARSLAVVPNDGHTIVTTEAGLIPLLSGWPSVDAWGLNDAEIAHHGVISSERLRQIDPGVIFIHAPTKPGATTIDVSGDGFPPGWARMTDVLIRYADVKHYVLAAAYGGPGEPGSWVAYVRRGMTESDRLVRRLASLSIPGLENLAVPGAGPLPHTPRQAQPRSRTRILG